jgi:pyruvate-formate lyase-activating enzyme
MEGRNIGIEQAEAAGHLLAELNLVRDDLRHGKISEEGAMARVRVIRQRARWMTTTAVPRSMAQLTMQWDTLIAVAEQLKEAFQAQEEPQFVH